MTFFKVIFACLFAIGIYNVADTAVTMYLQIGPVYTCSSDKGILPKDVALQCKRLTRGQWWHK